MNTRVFQVAICIKVNDYRLWFRSLPISQQMTYT